MTFIQPWLEVDFGSRYSGLSTVGFRLYKADGSDSVARTVTGVVEVSGNGCYGVASVSIPEDAVGIEWDTGDASPLYATEDLDLFRRMQTVSGLLHEKGLIDQVVENGDGNMLTARLRVYDTVANQEAAEATSPAGGTTGLIATYTIRATYNGRVLNTYVVVPQ